MIGPAEAAKQLPAFMTIGMDPTPTVNILAEIIRDKDSLDPSSASERAEQIKNAFIKKLQQERQHADKDGSFVIYAFSSSGTDYIQGACFVEGTDTHEVAEAKRKRSLAYDYYQACESVNPTTFEKLCSKTLELFGANDPIVTRASADQGIDFFGCVPFGELLQPRAITPGAEKQLKIWLVGQAKHYQATQVSTKDIRELVGSVALAKAKEYAGLNDPLSQLNIRSCDPVFYLFFTTGSLSRDARDLLRKAGVIAMDGMQLSVFLADNEIATVSDAFDPARFDTWLNS